MSTIARPPKMNAALADEVEEILAELKTISRSNILFYHSLGDRIGRIQSETAKYGDEVIPKICAAINMDDAVIYKAIHIAEQFSRKEIEAWLQKFEKADRVLHISYVIALARVADAQQRKELLDLVIDKKLTVAQLVEEVKKRLHGKGTSRAMPPRTPMGRLDRVASMSARFLETFEELDDSLFGPLTDIDRENIDETLLTKLDEGVAALLALASQADTQATRMKKTRTDLEERAKRPAAAKPKRWRRPLPR